MTCSSVFILDAAFSSQSMAYDMHLILIHHASAAAAIPEAGLAVVQSLPESLPHVVL